MAWLQDLIKSSQSPQNLKASASDAIVWAEASQGSDAIRELVKTGEEKLPTWGPLLQDIFHVFWKTQPTLADPDSVDPSHLANRSLLEGLLNEPATADTRVFSMLDETISAIAALEAGKRLVQAIESDPDLNKAAQDIANGLKNAPPAVDGTLSPSAQQAIQQFQSALQQSGSTLRKAIRQSARAAAQKAEETQETVISWGLDTGAFVNVPPQERITLAELFSTPRFRKLGELIGRLRNLGLSKQREHLRHLSDEIHSITRGDDLARLLPVELAALLHPARRLDFGRRLIERQLMEYALKPRHKDKRGPIIVMIDRSGSMTGYPGEWAAAVGLALLDIARRQRRDFAACYFDTDVDPVFRFPRNTEPSAKDIIAFASVQGGGGTSFEAPLTWALDLQAEADDFKKADIVMISDGECEVSDAFLAQLLAAKKARGVRIFSVLIGGVAEEMTRWSNRVWSVMAPDDLTAGELFEEVLSEP